MSHDPSRKHFLAKLIGLVALAGVAPKLFAKSAAALPTRLPSSAPAPVTPPVVALQPETRAIARRAGTA